MRGLAHASGVLGATIEIALGLAGPALVIEQYDSLTRLDMSMA